MAAPARTPAANHIELSVNEARIRFLQLVRQIRATRQTVVIIDQGQPVAAIVSPHMAADQRPEAAGMNASAAGWLQRLEKVRHDMRRQHDAHTAELLQALDEAWTIIDTLRPPGADRRVDTLRTTHAQLRRRE